MGNYEYLLRQSGNNQPNKPAQPTPVEPDATTLLPTLDEGSHDLDGNSRDKVFQPKQDASKHASTHASKHASKRASTQMGEVANLVETIRKRVRKVGKESIYVRLTQEEKEQITDIVINYKQSGTRTSDNEIARIALGLLIEDHRSNGTRSVLARVLEALNN